MSKTQQNLELAAKAVTDACKALVKQVKTISSQPTDEDVVDYKSMASHEFKVREMEQQVEILKLEKDLGAARRRLGEMRRAGCVSVHSCSTPVSLTGLLCFPQLPRGGGLIEMWLIRCFPHCNQALCISHSNKIGTIPSAVLRAVLEQGEDVVSGGGGD